MDRADQRFERFEQLGRFEPLIMPRRHPDWIKVKAPGNPNYLRLKRILREKNLHTVCEEARCPNIGECWGNKTATFLILGDTCTRGCRFCAIDKGKPLALDPEEPRNVALVVKDLGLDHLVVTYLTAAQPISPRRYSGSSSSTRVHGWSCWFRILPATCSRSKPSSTPASKFSTTISKPCRVYTARCAQATAMWAR